MKPLADFPLAARKGIRGVLTDIDDTLTLHGQLPAIAYAALERLKAAGLLVIPVTGRPAGWCDHIARMWPVDAVVGENGAFWFRHDPRAGKLVKRYVVNEEERALRRARLGAIADRVLREVPGSAIASDQDYREADLAIDFREDVPPLPLAQVQRIVEIMQSEGLGRNFGANLTQFELEHLVAQEWAQTAEDVLWRRTKCGLHMTEPQRDAVAQFMKDGR